MDLNKIRCFEPEWTTDGTGTDLHYLFSGCDAETGTKCWEQACDNTVRSVFQQLLDWPSAVVHKIATTLVNRTIATLEEPPTITSPEEPPKSHEYCVCPDYSCNCPGSLSDHTYIPAGVNDKVMQSIYGVTKGYGDHHVTAYREYNDPVWCCAHTVIQVIQLEKEGTGVLSDIIKEGYYQQGVQCYVEHPQGPTSMGTMTVTDPHTVTHCKGSHFLNSLQLYHSSAKDGTYFVKPLYSYASTEVVRDDGGKAPYQEQICNLQQLCFRQSGIKLAKDPLPLFDKWHEQNPGSTIPSMEEAREAENVVMNKVDMEQPREAENVVMDKADPLHWQNYVLAAAGATAALYCFHQVYQNLRDWSQPSSLSETTGTRVSKISRVATWAIAGTANAYLCLNQLKIV